MYIYIYVPRTFVFETFLFPFVTFQVSRDFDVKFEKWEKEDLLDGKGRILSRDLVRCFGAILMIFFFFFLFFLRIEKA